MSVMPSLPESKTRLNANARERLARLCLGPMNHNSYAGKESLIYFSIQNLCAWGEF
uniref:Uncharacterized protein n=1 Tax=Candidatus Kentrum sp. UNK TaxID=2126344 RepID=A0A451ADY7_9GAMM|nr:MAG: hypothetical protein BECKUNK1418G_GA0071005_10447 [Candidatus Kentron sp. UNK]VFK71040.1 MAG: hypothetical protein BECKUNK1418H_GA0071006_10487 [Candidatus Kentron sp. UNK]